MDTERFSVTLCVPEAALQAVSQVFAQLPSVSVRLGSPLAASAEAVLVPLNSFGFFDSGLALHAADRFGFHLQEELRRRIETKHFGELLVGDAELLPTGVGVPQWIVAAPVARTVASDLRHTVNAYLATRGALLAIRRNQKAGITSLAMPLIGHSEGKLSAYAAARQIRYGIRAVLRPAPRRVANLSKAARREKDLTRQEPPPKDTAS